jgi:hypothetical protein
MSWDSGVGHLDDGCPLLRLPGAVGPSGLSAVGSHNASLARQSWQVNLEVGEPNSYRNSLLPGYEEKSPRATTPATASHGSV